MESIKEFIESNPLSFMIVVIVVVIGILLVIKWKQALKKDNLNRDLGNSDDDLDEYEDDKEEPKGRFFVIESYYLPDDWDDAFELIVDRKTKVQYLCFGDYGITPLIDADGKPILYKDDEEDQEESE